MGKDKRTLTIKVLVGLIWKEFVALKYKSLITQKPGRGKKGVGVSSDLLMSSSDFYNKQLLKRISWYSARNTE